MQFLIKNNQIFIEILHSNFREKIFERNLKFSNVLVLEKCCLLQNMLSDLNFKVLQVRFENFKSCHASKNLHLSRGNLWSFDFEKKIIFFQFPVEWLLSCPKIKPKPATWPISDIFNPKFTFLQQKPITDTVIFSIQIFGGNSLHSSYAVTGVGSKNK